MSDRTYQKIKPVELNIGLGRVKALYLDHSAAASVTFTDYDGDSRSITIPARTPVPFGATKVTAVGAGTLYVMY
tara:strand:- start:781 stop:1002 length:222 start_codon:yes stop_codon:yes gene_type:complete